MPTIKPTSEADIQKAFVQWLRLRHPNIWHHHSPNEGQRKPWYTAALKLMGMCNGWADLEIIIGKQIHFMEFKTPKGRMSKTQKLFQTYCIGAGIPHAVPRSTSEAISIFQEWHQLACQ